MKTRTAATIFLFAGLQLLFSQAVANGTFDRFQATHHGWVWWGIKGYKERPRAPDVVMIGSSLLQHVIYQGEADYLKQPVNALNHNTSQHFADRLSANTTKPVSCHAIAIGGMHASDASLITMGLMRNKRPAALIYLIAPRDVMDNSLPSPRSTDTFQIMSRIIDTTEVARKSCLTRKEQFEFAVESAIGKLDPIYDNRRELRFALERDWRGLIARSFDRVSHGVKYPVGKLGLIVQDFDLAGTVPVLPFNPVDDELCDNRSCYTCTYQPVRPGPYYDQLKYLQRMLSFARQNGIQPILVNMPLRRDNFTCMAPKFYSLYVNDLSRLSQETGAQLIDIQKTAQFGDKDFIDSVHLNGRGAMKFIDLLADKLGPRLSAYIEKRHTPGDQSAAALASKQIPVY